jgi:dipeptidyl aminopeptidase/acylaminoacyl peptidase
VGPTRTPARRRRLLIGAIGVALVGALGLPAILMLGRVYPPRIPIDDTPASFGLAFEDVVFPSRDGAELRGWYLPSVDQTSPAVVFAHGIDDNRLQGGVALPLAKALVDGGFAVLLFDLRGSGESGTAAQTLGANERWDVLAAVDLARSRGARALGVIGFSMGAVASIAATAEDPSVAALVTDSAYADLHETLVRGMAESFLLPAPLAEYPLAWFRLLTGTDPSSVRPVDVIGAIAPRPILIIHGAADQTVPAADSDRLLEAAASPFAERWLVPGGRHTLSYEATPDGYTRRVVEFFETHLGSRPASRTEG